MYVFVAHFIVLDPIFHSKLFCFHFCFHLMFLLGFLKFTVQKQSVRIESLHIHLLKGEISFTLTLNLSSRYVTKIPKQNRLFQGILSIFLKHVRLGSVKMVQCCLCLLWGRVRFVFRSFFTLVSSSMLLAWRLVICYFFQKQETLSNSLLGRKGSQGNNEYWCSVSKGQNMNRKLRGIEILFCKTLFGQTVFSF